jgi:hypothetical protein
MRVAASVVWVGVMMFSLTNLALAAAAWVETLAVLARACTTVVKLDPSFDTWMS